MIGNPERRDFIVEQEVYVCATAIGLNVTARGLVVDVLAIQAARWNSLTHVVKRKIGGS